MQVRFEKIGKKISQTIVDIKKTLSSKSKLKTSQTTLSILLQRKEPVNLVKVELPEEEKATVVAECKTLPSPKKHRGYRLAGEIEDSDYSDDEGNFGPDAKPFASGAFDQVRSLRPKNRHRRRSREEPIGKKLVFSPVGHEGGQDEGEPLDPSLVEQIQKKQHFHNALYPERPATLAFFKGTEPNNITTFDKIMTYRFVREGFPGVPFKEVKIHTPLEAIDFFLSAAQELLRVHQKGYVLGDLHAENFFYDVTTKAFYCIDGGNSFPPGDLAEEIFHSMVQRKRVPPAYYAPEIWTVADQERAKMQPKMDVYSLGIICKQLFSQPDLASHEKLSDLIESCIEKDPKDRISLPELLTQLTALREEMGETSLSFSPKA